MWGKSSDLATQDSRRDRELAFSSGDLNDDGRAGLKPAGGLDLSAAGGKINERNGRTVFQTDAIEPRQLGQRQSRMCSAV